MVCFIRGVWLLIELAISILLLIFFIWTFWHGLEVKTGGIEIEMYGIGRFFNKWKRCYVYVIIDGISYINKNKMKKMKIKYKF